MPGQLLGQVVVAALGGPGPVRPQKLDHLPVAARIDQGVIDAQPIHPRHPLVGVRIVGRMDRRPASVLGRSGDEMGQQLGRARPFRGGQAGQEITGKGEGQAVHWVGEPIREFLQRMLTGSELDGFPMRVDIDDHDHTPNIPGDNGH